MEAAGALFRKYAFEVGGEYFKRGSGEKPDEGRVVTLSSAPGRLGRYLERLSAANALKKVIGRPAIFDMLRYQSASQTVGAIPECYNREWTMDQLPRTFSDFPLTPPAELPGVNPHDS